MTTPGQPAPDGAITDGDLAPLGGLSETAWRDEVGAREVDRFNGAGSLWRGFWQAPFDQTADLTDGQNALQPRIDLLAEISAYGSAVMGKNWQLPTNSTWVDVPFDVQVGPSKHVAVVTDPGNPKTGHLRVEGGGLWRADLLMCGRGHTTQYGLRPQTIGGVTTFVPTYTAYPVRIDYRIVIRQGEALVYRRDYVSAGVPFSAYSEYSDSATPRVNIERSNACAATFVFDPALGSATVHVQARVIPLASGWFSESNAQIFGGTITSSLALTRWSVDDINIQYVDNPATAGTL